MFLTKPAPFKEAADAIRSLAPVDRATFDNLIPELRDGAITIAGIEGLNTVVRVRDIIARLPVGGDFEALKAEIETELSPWFNEKAASKRATLLLRLHGFRAYAAAGYQQMEANTAAFPYRQYVATMDEKTRHSHRALHGVVLPSDHPFWLNHTGPWAWGCRCEAVPLTRGAAERIKAADKQRDPDKALVLEGPLLARLELGELVRGPTMIFDIRTDAERTGDPNAFEWVPGRAVLGVDEIRKRYEPAEFAAFETWAKQVTTGDGRNLWDALTEGREDTPPPPPEENAPVSPEPTPAPAGGSGAARTLASLQAEARALADSLAAKDAEWRELSARMQGMSNLEISNMSSAARMEIYNKAEAALKEVQAGAEKFRELVAIPEKQRGSFTVEALKERKMNRKTWQYEEKAAAGAPILKHVKKGGAIVTRWVAAKLVRPALVASHRGREHWSPRTDAIYVGSGTSLSTIAHELVHSIEGKNPAVLAKSRAFLAKRAGGQPVKRLRDLTGVKYDLSEVAFEDDWAARQGCAYSGKLYAGSGRIEDAYATELLTMGIERLERGAFEFHRDDPEYFWFVISTLQDL